MATGTAVTDYVVKVYDTKVLAEAGLDSTAFKVVSSSSSIIQNLYQDNDNHFFTFQRYYIRIEAPEPVKAMYIDWDDGEDNSEEKANSEWQIFETPQTYGIFEHIFTKNGTFYPLIRLLNNYDFKSKYYTPNGGDHAALDAFTITAGQQGTSKVSIDSTTNPRIPIFKPANMPPTGVLKLSKNRIYSGIDNDNIDGTYLLYAYWDGSGITPTTVKLTYEDTQGRISRKTITSTATEGAIEHLPDGAPSHNGVGSIYVKRLLKAELVNMTEGDGGLNSTDRMYIKANLGGGEAANSSTDPTITILSLGSPIQKERDAMYSLLADGSESRTKSSNRTIGTYFFDDDKLNVGGVVQASTLTDETDAKEGEVSDYLVAGLTNLDIGQKTFSYTFGNEINQPKDSYGRFYDEQRLIRLQVKDNHTAVVGDQITRSSIESFTRNGIYGPYSAEPEASHTRKQPTSLNHEALLMFTNDSGVTGDTNWVELSTRNFTDTDYIISNTGSGDYSIQTTADIDTHPENYLLMVKTEKFDRIHVRMNNGRTFDEEAEMRVVAWYAGKSGADTVWKPLKIIDGTRAGGDGTSLYRSGTISFNRPEDWTATQADAMYGGTLDSGVDEWLLGDGSPVEAEIGSAGSDADPITSWNFSGYGILIGISATTTDEDNQLQVANVWPYNNSHSQPVNITDPHHVSLNSFAIAESISFGRQTKIRTTESRLGVTDIQKIGASGGSISFGSPDFGTNRKIFKEHQQNATPVYLDITHQNSDITRFFGVITKMSEDHPLGKMTRKYSVTMQIAYIIELNSDGTMLSDGRIALGGLIINEPEYIL